MKRLLFVFTLLLLASLSYAVADNANVNCFDSGLCSGSKASILNSTTAVGAGDMYVPGDLEVGGRIFESNLITRTDVWQDLLAKSSFVVSGAAGILIDTATLRSPTSSWMGTQLSEYRFAPARNLRIWTLGDPEEAVLKFSTHSFVLVHTITGHDGIGRTQTETIRSNNALSIAVSTKAWGDITSITSVLTGAPVSWGAGTEFTNLKILIGNGDIMGFTGDTNNVGDIFAVNETYVFKALSTYTFDYTYDTWKPTNVPDGSIDYRLRYKCNSN